MECFVLQQATHLKYSVIYIIEESQSLRTRKVYVTRSNTILPHRVNSRKRSTNVKRTYPYYTTILGDVE